MTCSNKSCIFYDSLNINPCEFNDCCLYVQLHLDSYIVDSKSVRDVMIFGGDVCDG